MTLDEFAKLATALAKGKTLQYNTSEGWKDYNVDDPTWIGLCHFSPYKWRIKKRELTVKIEVRRSENGDLFVSHVNDLCITPVLGKPGEPFEIRTIEFEDDV